MKRDYKTLFWVLASLLVAFCACAVPPKYVGTFVGDGAGITNLPSVSSWIYLDSINGNDSNSGTSPGTPLQTVSALLSTSYFGTSANNLRGIYFNPGSYVLPTASVMYLSNNLVIGYGATLAQPTNSTGTDIYASRSTISMYPYSEIRGLTVLGFGTNGPGRPICPIPLGVNGQTFKLQDVTTMGWSDGLFFSGNAAQSNSYVLIAKDCDFESAYHAVDCANAVATIATNSLFEFDNCRIYVNTDWTNGTPLPNLPSLCTDCYGYSFSFGKIFIHGGSVSVIDGGAQNSGIYLWNGNRWLTNGVIIDNVMMNTATIYSTNAVTSYGIECQFGTTYRVVQVMGHPYPDSFVKNARTRITSGGSNNVIYYSGWNDSLSIETNTIGGPPSTAISGGASYIWNSNGMPYMVQSVSAKTIWAVTNVIGPIFPPVTAPNSNTFWSVFGLAVNVTNHIMQNVAGALTDYWSDGTNVYSKALAP